MSTPFYGDPVSDTVYKEVPGSRHPVRCATVANISDLSAVATNSAAFDGLTIALNERVLVMSQSTASQNGIYVVESVTSGVATLVRAADFDDSDWVFAGVDVQVVEGTANAGEVYYLSTPNPITLGTTALTFSSPALAGADALVTLAPATATRNTVVAQSATVKPLIVKGAGSQSANLLEAQNSAGTQLAAINASGQLVSSLSTGTAPLSVASTTVNTNLNADQLDGYHAGNGSGAVPVSNGTVNTNLNADKVDGLDADDFVIVAPDSLVNVISPSDDVVALRIVPFASQSTDVFQVGSGSPFAAVTKIDKDGKLATTEQITSTKATGTAPFSVASTTLVSNLNVEQHGGLTLAQAQAQAVFLSQVFGG